MDRILYNGQLVWEPRAGGAYGIELELSANETGELVFTLPSTHPLNGRIQAWNKACEVVYERDGEELFRGRVSIVEPDPITLEITYTVEGERGYLNDSVLPIYSTDGSGGITVPANPASLFDWYIAQHRERTGEQWDVGINEGDMLNPNAYILRSSTKRPNTWAEIKDKLLERLGGYMRVRHQNGRRIIDWVAAERGKSFQYVEVGKNVVSASAEIDMRDYYTAFVPVGKDGLGIGSLEDGELSDGLYKRGDAVIITAEANRRGIIETTVDTESETAQGCLNAAIRAAKAMVVPMSFAVSAVDLSRIDKREDPIREGDLVRCRFPRLGIDAWYICLKRVIKPGEADEYTLGGRSQAITAEEYGGWKRVERTADESKRVADLARATADDKRRVFTAQPIPPYDVGDLWVQSDGSTVKVCTTAKEA